MKINIFGLGYVGCITAFCLGESGHQVTGIEIVPEKVKALKKGIPPIYEPGLNDICQKAINGKLKGSFRILQKPSPNDILESVASIICVGTPSLLSGEPDLSQISQTLTTLGQALGHTTRWHDVIIRSTVSPGSIENIFIPILEKESRKKAGVDFGVAFYPEFLREGSAIKDFNTPSLNALACLSDHTFHVVKRLFPSGNKLTRVEFKTAEMIKYLNNSFHALKVAFANEMGTICQGYGVNTEEVTKLFLKDTTLNISPYYLRPGFAFGGSCLPKELRTANALMLKKGLKGPLIQAISLSNDEHIMRFVAWIQSQSCNRIGFLGATFKPNTDDTRESPLIRSIHTLLKHPSYKQNTEIFICDSPMVLKKLNKEFAGTPIKFVTRLSQLMNSTDLLILGPHRLDEKDYSKMSRYKGIIYDLKWFTVPSLIKELPNYYSIC